MSDRTAGTLAPWRYGADSSVRSWARLLAGLALLVGLWWPSSAWAATIAVNSGAPDNFTAGNGCSLREAISNANANVRLHADCVEVGAYGDDTITVPGNVQTILDLTGAGENANATGDLDVVGVLTIQSAAAAAGFINAQFLDDRVFHVLPGATLTIANVAMNGDDAGANPGGGILNEGTLTLIDATVTGAGTTTGGFGLHNTGTATLLRSRVSNNEGTTPGGSLTSTGTLTMTASIVDNSHSSGSIAHGLSIEGGTATLTNVTISRNAGIGNTLDGAGLFVSAGDVTLNNVTIANNARGIERQGGSVTLFNTLIAANRFGANCTGTVVSGGYNLSDDATCTSFTQTGDLQNVDAQIDETAGNNGGRTDTHALQLGSPAIDAGNPATPLDGTAGRCAATDQRGVTRPQDGDGANGARCDIGAFEALRFQVTSTDDAVDATPGDFTCATAAPVRCTLRAAIQEANAAGSAAVILPANGAPYLLTIAGANEDQAATGDLDVRRNVFIIGGGAATTVVDGNDLDRVFDLHGGELVMSDVTVRNGNAVGAGNLGDGGGIRARNGTLNLQRVVVTANQAAGDGGGIASRDQSLLELRESIVGENVAAGSGGGLVINDNSNSRIFTSTIRGNQAASGGGIRIDETDPRLVNVTVSGNSATTEGGGILVGGAFGGQARISASTIANNQAPAAGGLRVLARTFPGPEPVVEIFNSIVANNAVGDCIPERITSRGYNLSSTATCSFTATGDRQGVDPKLGPLANNGGPTPTHALLTASPALDAGNPEGSDVSQVACPETDQRGEPRPRDGDGNGTPRCDIGAFEQQTPLVANLRLSLADAPDPVGAGAEVVFTVTVTNDGPLPATGVMVTVDASVPLIAVSQSVPANCTTPAPPDDPLPCALTGGLANGASATLTYRATAPAAGPTSTAPTARIFSLAQVRATEPDPNLANNDQEGTTTVQAACAARPRLTQQTRPLGNGRLEVVVRATTTAEQPTNALVSLRFTQLQNARVSVDGQPAQASPFTVTLPPNRQEVVLIVERVQPGQAATVGFEAVDVCGAWPTFVGGGAGAF